MVNITRETPFSELPPQIKHKIINIRNAAANKLELGNPMPLRDMGLLAVPSSKSLSKSFLRLHQAAQSMKGTDVEESLQKELQEFQELLRAYRDNYNSKDFVGELDRTVSLLESRFDRICRKGNARF